MLSLARNIESTLIPEKVGDSMDESTSDSQSNSFELSIVSNIDDLASMKKELGQTAVPQLKAPPRQRGPRKQVISIEFETNADFTESPFATSANVR